MTTTTFVVFGVIALIFSLMSFVQTGLIKQQRNLIETLKGENAHLKSKLSGLETQLQNYSRGIEDV